MKKLIGNHFKHLTEAIWLGDVHIPADSKYVLMTTYICLSIQISLMFQQQVHNVSPSLFTGSK